MARNRRNATVTMADVARVAGVAVATVSRALAAPGLVRAETRGRVAAAVDRLGYIPDHLAGSLSSRRSGLVAVVVPSIDNAVFSTKIQGLSDALAGSGIEVMIADSGGSHRREYELARAFVGRRVEGLVLTGVARAPQTRALLLDSGIPVVETWNLGRKPIDMNVGFSNRAAARAMTGHLIETGRRRVAMICGPRAGDDRARARRLGYLDTVRRHDMDDSLIFDLVSMDDLGDARRAVDALLARCPDVDGIFCSGDAFALGTLFELQRRGIAVPERIGVAGVGDIRFAQWVRPPLTTAKVPGYDIGRMAGEMILKRVAGEPIARPRVDVGFEIVRRGST